jgi:CubicO group peptidase (beta-lactamase class C family)
MAKTIVSLLVGVALEEKKIKSLDEKVSNYLPSFNLNSRNEITIRHLLTMSAGFDWEESGKNPLSETAEAYYGTNLKRLVTTQGVDRKPGEVFHYQSGNTQLLSMIVEKATGMTISKYAEIKLWKKIGAENEAQWSLDREGGDEKAFCCFYATARDFALLGRLVLNKGNWNGDQIVSKKYIEEMSSPNEKLITEDGLKNLVYGYQFWIYKNNKNRVVYFRGLLGQYILVIPSENTIVVRLGEKIEKNFKPHRIPLFTEKTNKFDELVGHSMDIIKYLEMKNEIVNQHKKSNERRAERA